MKGQWVNCTIVLVSVAAPLSPGTLKTMVNPPDNPLEESVVFQFEILVVNVTSSSVMSVMTAVPVRVLPETVPRNVPVIAPSRTFPDTALWFWVSVNEILGVAPATRPVPSQKPLKIPSSTQVSTRYVPAYWPWKSDMVPPVVDDAVGERGSLWLQPAETAKRTVISARRLMFCVVKKTSMSHGGKIGARTLQASAGTSGICRDGPVTALTKLTRERLLGTGLSGGRAPSIVASVPSVF